MTLYEKYGSSNDRPRYNIYIRYFKNLRRRISISDVTKRVIADETTLWHNGIFIIEGEKIFFR